MAGIGREAQTDSSKKGEGQPGKKADNSIPIDFNTNIPTSESDAMNPPDYPHPDAIG